MWFVPHRERLDTVLVDVLDTAQDSLSGQPGIGPDTDAELFTVPASTLWALRLTHPFEPVQHPATG